MPKADLTLNRFHLYKNDGLVHVELTAPVEKTPTEIDLNGMDAITYGMSWCAANLAEFLMGSGLGDQDLITKLCDLAAELYEQSEPALPARRPSN